MHRVIIGTAGHIDHGKTRLVEALTGIDCDRWAAEKQRGITIDIGFAFLRAGDLQLGFIDVPGHERFLHNALAGLGGIRVMLLVVAADEGVKPQTREHLAICSLLQIPAALVALTKTDLVDEELAELAALEVEELLAPTPFAGSEIVPVSSLTGAGIPELAAKLLALAQAHAVPPERERPVRLPVDRAFHLKGLGLVVTGTLVSGAISPGAELVALPVGQGIKQGVRVRDVQVHGEAREVAEAGERTSLRLSGVELADMERGVEIVTPDAFGTSRRLLARVRILPEAPEAITGWTPVRLHLLTSEGIGRLRPVAPDRLEPGGEGLVEIRLRSPVVAIRGDRIILRRPSPQATLGGGVIVDPAWRQHRGKALAAALAQLGGPATGDGRREALLYWVRDAGEAGIEAEDIARRLGERPAAAIALLTALTGEQHLLAAPAGQGHGRRWLAPAAYARVVERVEKVLAEHFRQDRLSPGLPKAEAVERFFPSRARDLSDVYLHWLSAQKKIVVSGGRVTLPGRSAELTGEESRLATAVAALYDRAALEPPSPADASRELGAKPQILEGVIRYLVDGGKLVRLPNALVISATAITRLREDLAATGWERFSVPQFKDHFGLTRKWAIPLLEHMDSIGATRRLGDERMVVR